MGRTQKLPEFHHIVMIDPKATIQRPPEKIFDTRNVIKADQFPTWHKRFPDSLSVGEIFNSVLNLRSQDTIKEWGEKLMRQHRPEDFLTLPDFIQPREPMNPAPAPGLGSTVSSNPPAEPVKRCICAHCGAKISFPEGKFCWNNPQRFGGLAYCREHQTMFQVA